MREFTVDKLRVVVSDTQQQTGQCAAQDAALYLRELLESQDEVRIIFAAAISQDTFLEALRQEPGIDWRRVHAYHMDEYVGLPKGDPRSLGEFLNKRFLSKLTLGGIHLMNGAADPEREAERYAKELTNIDVVFMGIGDNGHLAFNDPHVADFHDEKRVKLVDIDEVSKIQQVNAGNFPSVDAVPSWAFTVTIPALLDCRRIFCVVPTRYKAAATRDALTGPVSETCPASILRGLEYATLYLDADSAGLM